ncbi:hypothetical protein HOLleu_23321 [Holothuria leucospilota]|uniref:Uncharacterized protein n=1 Tax=Holothuria leucospilota TaxID=206669 RepID=A0A9Q1BUN7_HOLLE|nr:hypothetical protein HOLleu_23321 [Holothuria leucospilota]
MTLGLPHPIRSWLLWMLAPCIPTYRMTMVLQHAKKFLLLTTSHDRSLATLLLSLNLF